MLLLFVSILKSVRRPRLCMTASATCLQHQRVIVNIQRLESVYIKYHVHT
jgi:hypothetical protein